MSSESSGTGKYILEATFLHIWGSEPEMQYSCT